MIPGINKALPMKTKRGQLSVSILYAVYSSNDMPMLIGSGSFEFFFIQASIYAQD